MALKQLLYTATLVCLFSVSANAQTVGELKVGNEFTRNLIALSPILLHLLLLVWVWASKMSLKEALADKETVRTDRAGLLRLEEEKLRALFPRSGITTGPTLPDTTTLLALIQSDQDLRLRFLDIMVAKNIRANEEGEKPVLIGSVSRLIVFMAGHAGVAIGSCLASFVIFYKLNTNANNIPDLNGLVGVILALGIGVVPYAVNRFTANNEAPDKPGK
jgi:hypothetical protein